MQRIQGDSAVTGDRDGTRYSLATIYRYYLSKRPRLWAAASLTEGNGLYKKGRDNAVDPTRSKDIGVGLVTHF